MLEILVDPNAWIALATLTALEIVLGVDNIIFIAILVSQLEKSKQRLARRIGLSLALGFRILFLSMISWIAGLKDPVFTLAGISFSWRDIILFLGGAFLLVKAIHEIKGELASGGNYHHGDSKNTLTQAAFSQIIIQIIFIDIIFSVDSIITAIGMSNHLPVMITAVIIAIIIMYLASGPIADFVAKYPTVKMLALAFLVMIGVVLIADGVHIHIPRPYIYTALLFSCLVEGLNIFAKVKKDKNGNHSNIKEKEEQEPFQS